MTTHTALRLLVLCTHAVSECKCHASQVETDSYSTRLERLTNYSTPVMIVVSFAVNYMDVITDVQVLLQFWRTGNLVLFNASAGLMVLSGVLTCVLEYTLIGGWKGMLADKLVRQLAREEGEEGEGADRDEGIMQLFGFRCVLNMLQLRMAYESARALYLYVKYRRGVHDGMSQSKASEGFFEALPQSPPDRAPVLEGAVFKHSHSATL